MLRYATALFSILALPAAAQCVGDSFYDLLGADQKAELEASVADLPYARGLTWAATRGEDTLTILGTIHVFDPRLAPIREKTGEALRSADLVMLEATPVEEAALQDMITTDPGRLFIVDGPTLPERLDEETWQLVSDAATQRGIPGFMAAKMQPWYLSLTLAIPPCAMQEMTSGLSGLDKMVIADAQAAGVPMQALEPFTVLFDLFEGQSIAEQIDMLRVNMLDPALQQQMFVAMLDLYFAEEVGKLWNMSRIAIAQTPGLDPVEGMAIFEQMQASLLDQRNRNWFEVIKEATASNDDIFIAIGAAHLIGDAGILQLLENDGWTVTQIP
ncbi:TraB/GumN family protein [Yoonia sp.]|uniref:TraB/GumN family protein n=1 Tax=Yoonia sp. TaxID=2212373 RepID=UPI0035C83457